MDSSTLFKANVYLTILFLSLDKHDEKDAFYIKCLLALGATAGTFGYLFQGPARPCVPPTTPPTVPKLPPTLPPTGPEIKGPPPVVPTPPVPQPPAPPVVTPPPVPTPPVPPVPTPPTGPFKVSDFTVTLIDPQPYHSGAVLFKRCYKNILTQLNQALLNNCFGKLQASEIKTPNKNIKITLNRFTVNGFVNTSGININLGYLENLYTKYESSNNIDIVRQNLTNELLKMYLEYLKLPSGSKQVDIKEVLVTNTTGINIGGRTREIVDNRDIYGFAARTLPFKFEHLDLTDFNYINTEPYKKYRALLDPLGAPETEYYLIVAREISNLLNPGEMKTALHELTRKITIKLDATSPGVAAFVRTYSHGDTKNMIWNRDFLGRTNLDTGGRQSFISVLTHETAHCVDQVFSKNKVATASYASEGFASWCENKIKGTSWAKWKKPRPADWRGAYDVFAVFLEYVDRNSPDFVVKYHNLKVNIGYSEEIIKTVSGKSGDEWWRLYLSDPERKV